MEMDEFRSCDSSGFIKLVAVLLVAFAYRVLDSRRRNPSGEMAATEAETNP
jgi:hypothetical protein